VKPSDYYCIAGVVAAIAGVIILYISTSDVKSICSAVIACAGVLLVAGSYEMKNTEKILENMENWK